MATKIINPPAASQAAEVTKPRYGTTTFHCDTTLADCDVLDIREWRDIAIKPVAAVTAVAVYAAETADGTFVLVDNIGTAGSVTVTASKWNVLDITKIAPFGFVKLVPTGAEGTFAVVGKT